MYVDLCRLCHNEQTCLCSMPVLGHRRHMSTIIYYHIYDHACVCLCGMYVVLVQCVLPDLVCGPKCETKLWI